MLRLLAALAIGVALFTACGSEADRPLHQQAVDAFKRWHDSFETVEYATTALGVGERPTGAFEVEGEARYRRDPESVWAILFLGDANAQDERATYEQLRVGGEDYLLFDGVWTHQGSGDDSNLTDEVRTILGAPIITDRQVIERWLECAETSFGSTTTEAWRGAPAWIIRCQAEDDLGNQAATELIKSVMGTLFGQAPGDAEQLAARIDAAEVGYLLALQAVIHREGGALLMLDLAITLSDQGARSDIRWQMELLSADQPINFPDAPD